MSDTKSILQLTLVGRYYNFHLGADLQALALHNILRKVGNCNIIDYSPPSYLFDLSKKAKSILKNEGILYLFKTETNFILRNLIFKSNKKIAKKFSHFRQNNFKFTDKTFTRFKELEEYFSNSEDIFIVGSDVVWSARHNTLESLRVNLLGFVKNGIKASYAASVVDPIPKNLRPIYAEHLKEFDFISVREETSRKYLQDILPNAEIEVVLDPTLLLSKEQWLEVAKKPLEVPERPYILVYDLLRSEKILKPTLKFAKRNNFNVITFSYSLIRKITHPKVKSFYLSDPSEFLWLINNAEFVVSSSFHGTLFAVIFQKPFAAIDPEPFGTAGSKISDFLHLIESEDRFLREPKDIEKISMEVDWKTINHNLEKQRRHSLDYLKRVVNA